MGRLIQDDRKIVREKTKYVIVHIYSPPEVKIEDELDTANGRMESSPDIYALMSAEKSR